MRFFLSRIGVIAAGAIALFSFAMPHAAPMLFSHRQVELPDLGERSALALSEQAEREYGRKIFQSIQNVLQKDPVD